MIKRTIIFCITISSILLGFNSSAQENSSNVTITASGRGASQAEAQQNALRSAIEQAYGAFISSKTEILNDEIIADQMSSVASGNIQSFEILNETELSDHSWASTIKAVVSIEKLTSFVQSKGIEVEIKGGLFAANIKQQMLNEQGEVKAIYNMVGILHEVMQNAFDFTLSTGVPQALDTENKNWKIPIEIDAIGNLNLDFTIDYLTKTLISLDMRDEEKENYKSMNKPVFTFSISYYEYDTQSKTYLNRYRTIDLRKSESLKIIGFFSNLLRFYTTNFSVQNNLDVMPCELNLQTKSLHKPLGNDDGFEVLAYALEKYSSTMSKPNAHLNLNIHNGQSVAKYSTFEEWDLENLNLLEGYKINSRGKNSSFELGGITMFSNTYNTILAMIQPSLCDMKSIEGNLKISFSGYDDWRLPTWEEMETFDQLNLDFFGKFVRGRGSSTWGEDANTGKIGINHTNDEYQKYYNVSSLKAYIIAVRDGDYLETESGE